MGDKKDCSKCVCKTCHDYACSIWRCCQVCKLDPHTQESCEMYTERNPDGDDLEDD